MPRMEALRVWMAVAALAATAAALAACAPQTPPAVVAARAQVPRTVDYTTDVRPILSNNCFSCHGNDAGNRKAGLRLDTAEGAYAALKGGKRAIVPGNVAFSEVFKRITSGDPEVRMPPKEVHKTLGPVEIATIERWIQQGAKYKPHWAYVQAVAVKPGKSPWGDRAKNDIDRYVQAKLSEKGLQPSAEADRETLINRVTLDLTGLPPSLAQVDAFVADKSPDAYERLVDRILLSPEYAENQAGRWMDVARYSETDGFLDDLGGRYFAPYRDWVISAFKANMPYDKFVTWQLAGDLLPNASKEQVLATAFGRLGKRTTENGIIDEEYRVEYMMERTELVGTAFLGLTVGCARCHDHKYDAISQREYYSMGGFFNSIDERGLFAAASSGITQGPTLWWPTAAQQSDLDSARKAASEASAHYDAARAQAVRAALPLAQALAQRSSAEVRDAVASATDRDLAAYYPLDSYHKGSLEPFKVFRKSPLQANLQADETKPPPPDSRFLSAAARKPVAQRQGAPQLELPNALSQADLVLSPSGKSGVGEAMFEKPTLVDGVKGKAFLVNDSRGFFAKNVGWYERNQAFTLDFWVKPPVGKEFEEATVLNHQDHTVWTADSGYVVRMVKGRLRFDLMHTSPYNMISVLADGTVAKGKWSRVTVTYDGSSKAAGARIYVDGRPQAVQIQKDNLTRSMLPTQFRGSLGGDFYGLGFGKRFRDEEFTGGALDEIRVFNGALSPLQIAVLAADGPLVLDKTILPAQLADLLANQDATVIAAAADLRTKREAENKIASRIPEIMVMRDSPKPRQAYVLDRGLYNKHKDEVEPEAIAGVLAWDKKYPRTRLGLANWLFDPKNPLTARVYVNRVWEKHFGSGIVATVEDFGTQGANPTNPQLLDYLAVEFVRSGWDMRKLDRLIVTSATYRQSSNVSPGVQQQDPGNVYLTRGPRFRMPAEMLRDNALAASGLLSRSIGGRSAYPYQPAGIWETASVGSRYPVGMPVDQNHRRSMYTFVKRNAPPPSAAIFDFADRNVTSVKRRLSNTPLQSLVLLNDPQYVEAYRRLAENAMRDQDGPEAQITQIFRQATRRHPTKAELEILAGYRDTEVDRFRKSRAEAKELVSTGATTVDASLPVDQLAANTMVAAAVFNSPDAYSIR